MQIWIIAGNIIASKDIQIVPMKEITMPIIGIATANIPGMYKNIFTIVVYILQITAESHDAQSQGIVNKHLFCLAFLCYTFVDVVVP